MCQDTLFPLFGPYLFPPDSSCLSIYSYIKPQPNGSVFIRVLVVYLSIPTSNHNSDRTNYFNEALFICLFLHQTTTLARRGGRSRCCLSVYSYIKPQLVPFAFMLMSVVYLSIPTSNHNDKIGTNIHVCVVYLSIPTSNHNGDTKSNNMNKVVYLSIPTSNHNYVSVEE